MALKARLQRLHTLVTYVWWWRLKYWWFDTDDGKWARAGLAGFFALVALMHMIAAAVSALAPPDPSEPIKAYVWVVQLVIAIVAAILSYVLSPKPEPPKPVELEAPTVEPGASVIVVHGDVWLKEFSILAFRKVGEDKIKSGGKK